MKQMEELSSRSNSRLLRFLVLISILGLTLVFYLYSSETKKQNLQISKLDIQNNIIEIVGNVNNLFTKGKKKQTQD